MIFLCIFTKSQPTRPDQISPHRIFIFKICPIWAADYANLANLCIDSGMRMPIDPNIDLSTALLDAFSDKVIIDCKHPIELLYLSVCFLSNLT